MQQLVTVHLNLMIMWFCIFQFKSNYTNIFLSKNMNDVINTWCQSNINFQRNLPKVLWISEDATRVSSKVKYDSKTNKLIGFTMPLVNGMPVTDSFLATSAKRIQDYFQNGIRSNYAYVVMAQPLSPSAPGYCLSIFGTNNRFIADDLMKRWQHIKLNFKKRGIIVLGFASDGGTRFLKAMRQAA
ncbi:hypothetical protein RN001_013172 [Aquatica leii]|uniref:Uncharacterized protein n=1 Tax=Aquatica leii TaxID=1421715 RepID=A0AAN7SC97_9COLE|nr:hypothetical protein RN001_013172 [Aquatica leii]